METAAILGAAPTLTSIVGVPPPVPSTNLGAVVGFEKLRTENIRKRSTQIKYLHSMTEYTLHIWPNGTVNGVRTANSSGRKYGMLEFVSFMFLSTIYRAPRGESKDIKVEIRGVESKMWLCMNKTGALYGSRNKSHDCSFYQQYDPDSPYYTYYSVQHPNNTEKSVKWYIALNRHGRARIAMKSKHKSSKFLMRSTQAPDIKILPGWSTRTSSEPSTRRRKNRNRYNRLPNKNEGSRSKRLKSQTRKRKPEKSRKPKRDKLSKILSSIEQVLYESSSKEADLPSENFQESMLIDLGNSNPFQNLDTGDDIRHSAKFKTNRRRTYRRKQSPTSR